MRAYNKRLKDASGDRRIILHNQPTTAARHLLSGVWCVLCAFQSLGALVFVSFGSTNKHVFFLAVSIVCFLRSISSRQLQSQAKYGLKKWLPFKRQTLPRWHAQQIDNKLPRGLEKSETLLLPGTYLIRRQTLRSNERHQINCKDEGFCFSFCLCHTFQYKA